MTKCKDFDLSGLGSKSATIAVTALLISMLRVWTSKISIAKITFLAMSMQITCEIVEFLRNNFKIDCTKSKGFTPVVILLRLDAPMGSSSLLLKRTTVHEGLILRQDPWHMPGSIWV